jgi:hypothetical protein
MRDGCLGQLSGRAYDGAGLWIIETMECAIISLGDARLQDRFDVAREPPSWAAFLRSASVSGPPGIFQGPTRSAPIEAPRWVMTLRSKIGLRRFGHRHQPLAEEIAVVFVARDRRDWCVFDAAPALYRRPGCCKGARVLDKDQYIDRLAVGREFPALYHMELVSMRRAVVVYKRLG